jgi:hypothetical protein
VTSTAGHDAATASPALRTYRSARLFVGVCTYTRFRDVRLDVTGA